MKNKIFLYGVIAVLIFAVQLVLLFLYNLITFPLTSQDVFNSIESKGAVANREDGGAWAYLIANEDGYTLYTLSESPFINRYRYHLSREITDSFITAVPGKRNYIVLEVSGTCIQWTHADAPRLSVGNFISFFTFIIISTNFVYFLMNRKKIKKHE